MEEPKTERASEDKSVPDDSFSAEARSSKNREELQKFQLKRIETRMKDQMIHGTTSQTDICIET